MNSVTDQWLPVLLGLIIAGIGSSWLWISSRSSVYALQEAAITRDRTRMDMMQNEIDELRVKDRLREEELLELRLELIEHARGVEILINQVIAGGMVPQWMPRTKKPRRGGVRDLLSRRIEELFNLEELNSLAVDVGINPEEVPGETLSSRVRALVELSYRRGLLETLSDRVSELRPNAPK